MNFTPIATQIQTQTPTNIPMLLSLQLQLPRPELKRQTATAISNEIVTTATGKQYINHEGKLCHLRTYNYNPRKVFKHADYLLSQQLKEGDTYFFTHYTEKDHY